MAEESRFWGQCSADGATQPRHDELAAALSPRWRTSEAPLRVLAVIHNVTSATRMLDVLTALHSDERVQIFWTWTRSSPFVHGVPDLLSDAGFPRVSWEAARETPFRLAVSTSLGGELHEIDAPLLCLPHGMGYNKYLARRPASDTAATDPSASDPASSDLSASGPSVFGLSSEWLLHDGSPFPAATVLSHTEQRDRLARSCPEALDIAVVAGDPCYDRLLASLPRRDAYRAAFGLEEGQRLVTLTSTWGPDSLFARYPRLAAELLAELPFDEYRVALVLHPNIWHAHGPGQVAAWTANARRSGLILVPPREGWRAALVAADQVVGDHGSVAYYAAALGRPVLLDGGGRDAVDPESPVARLLDTTTRLERSRPFPEQFAAAGRHVPETTAVAARWVSSCPGRSLELIRSTMYTLMDATEPEARPPVDAVPAPTGLAGRPTALWTRVRLDGAEAHVHRYPAAVPRPSWRAEPGLLLVEDGEPDQRLAQAADVFHTRSVGPVAAADRWANTMFDHYPGARLAVAVDGARCRLYRRDAAPLALRVTAGTDADAGLVVSVLAARALDGRPVTGRFTVHTDETTRAIEVHGGDGVDGAVG